MPRAPPPTGMTMKLRTAWARLMDSLWFVPTAVGLAGVALAVGMVELSARVDPHVLARFPRIFGASADSSRSLLSAIGGSVITVAGVTFSLTMVAVTQASGQYTSRILRTFMRDRPTQIVLGTFVGIFAYCLLVLRTIRSVDESRFVPSLAVVLGIVPALAGMGALIFFVHHIASTLQASHLVERVGRETVSAVDRLFPDDVGHEASAEQQAFVLAQLQGAQWHPVSAKRSGYLQSVDADRLVRIATSRDVVIRLGAAVGEFVIEGTPIAATARSPENSSETRRSANRSSEPNAGRDQEVARCFVLGTFRTIDQDAGFGIRQMVDVALKALSPGVNDTTTAVTCVDWLGAVLVRLANRSIETPFRTHDGAVRIVANGATFESMLALAVDEIRQNAARNVSVLAALLEMIARVRRETRDGARREMLDTHARLVGEHAERHVEASHDRERLRRLAASARGAAETSAAPSLVGPQAQPATMTSTRARVQP
jgi:uncharacterized membrane protein